MHKITLAINLPLPKQDYTASGGMGTLVIIDLTAEMAESWMVLLDQTCYYHIKR